MMTFVKKHSLAVTQTVIIVENFSSLATVVGYCSDRQSDGNSYPQIRLGDDRN